MDDVKLQLLYKFGVDHNDTLATKAGTDPVNMLFCKLKAVNRLNPPNQLGMGPDNPMLSS